MDLSTLHRFHIAPGGDPADPETWVWENRSADLEDIGGLTITGGRADEIGQVSGGSTLLRVDNAGGHYCTTNPYGRWFGALSVGCPARWGVITGAEAWTTTTSNGWGTPDVGTSWSLDGSASDWSSSSGTGRLALASANTAGAADLVGADARDGMATFVAISSVVATGAGLRYSIMARRTGPSDNLLFTVELGLAGAVTASIRRDQSGITTLASASAGITYSASERIKARAQWDGPNLRLKVWEEASAEPDAWTVTTTDTLCAGAKVGVHLWRVAGNTNAGTVTLQVDDLEVEAVEAIGNIPAFPVKWDPTADTSYSPIEITGILRRLGQDEEALRSPMYKQISGYTNLVGYWPIEDGARAGQLANVVAGGKPGSVTGMTLGGQGPNGAAAAATFTNGDPTSKISGIFRGASTTAGWQISWSMKLSALPAAGLRQMIAWSTSSGFSWAVNLDSGIYNLRVLNAAGTTVLNSNVGFTGTGEPDVWTTFRMKATQSGGNIAYEFAWFAQEQETPWGVSGSFTGTVGALRNWTANGNSAMQGAAACHLFGVTSGTDDLLSFAARRAFDGYVGELAADRIARLCDEEGVPVAVEPGDSKPMGRQPIGGLLFLLRQCEAADFGILYEAGAAVGYRPSAGRYNRDVHMVLEIAPDGDIADPAPEPTDDDQRISNEWTVSRTDGSEATYRNEAHILKSGRRAKPATINIATDGPLRNHAAWRVHLGVWGEYRWPQITLVFSDRPDLLIAWLGRPFAPRITISGIPDQGPIGADADLIVEGWRQDITTTSWVVTLNCSPAKPWDVVVKGVTRKATARCTTASTLPAATGSGVSLTLQVDNPKNVWSQTATGYQIDTGGEVFTVTAMGAPSGSAPTITQVATVTRAVNGITVAHAIGQPVQLYPAPRKAL
jgi:hypothetical protein